MAKAPQLGTLLISDQRGPLTFKLQRGGYFIRDGRITISVETEGTNEDQYPRYAYFCLEAAPLEHDLRAGDKFHCKGGMFQELEDTGDGPRAHAYFEFHAEEVDLTFTVKEVGKTSIQVALTATHDDVNCYDDRAKRTPTIGMFELSEAPPGQLWVPV